MYLYLMGSDHFPRRSQAASQAVPRYQDIWSQRHSYSMASAVAGCKVVYESMAGKIVSDCLSFCTQRPGLYLHVHSVVNSQPARMHSRLRVASLCNHIPTCVRGLLSISAIIVYLCSYLDSVPYKAVDSLWCAAH